MLNYGITGKNITSVILSYLDFDSMVAARMVSKTWYRFIEKEQRLWINLIKKCSEEIQKKSTDFGWPTKRTDSSLPTGAYLEDWQKFGEVIKHGKVADVVTFISNFQKFNTSSYMNYLKYQNDTTLWQKLNFVKILVKYGVLERNLNNETWDYFVFGPFCYLLAWSLPYTKVTANPIGQSFNEKFECFKDFKSFGSHLHVAAKYGQIEIFKNILEYLEGIMFDWQKLKDEEGRSVYDLLSE